MRLYFQGEHLQQVLLKVPTLELELLQLTITTMQKIYSYEGIFHVRCNCSNCGNCACSRCNLGGNSGGNLGGNSGGNLCGNLGGNSGGNLCSNLGDCKRNCSNLCSNLGDCKRNCSNCRNCLYRVFINDSPTERHSINGIEFVLDKSIEVYDSEFLQVNPNHIVDNITIYTYIIGTGTGTGTTFVIEKQANKISEIYFDMQILSDDTISSFLTDLNLC